MTMSIFWLTLGTGTSWSISAQHAALLTELALLALYFGAFIALVLLLRLLVICNAAADYGKFIYVSFFKPHRPDGAHQGQQAALESFYKAQVRNEKGTTSQSKSKAVSLDEEFEVLAHQPSFCAPEYPSLPIILLAPRLQVLLCSHLKELKAGELIDSG